MRTLRTILLALTILPLTGCAEFIFAAPVFFGVVQTEEPMFCKRLWPNFETDEDCKARAAYIEKRKRGLTEAIRPDDVVFGVPVPRQENEQGWRVVSYEPEHRRTLLNALRAGRPLPHDLFAVARVKSEAGVITPLAGYVFVTPEMVAWE